MGNSGEKRKGRRHLPKAGTATDLEQMHHDERMEIAHDIGLDPRGRTMFGAGLTYALIWVAVAVLVVGVVVFWLLT